MPGCNVRRLSKHVTKTRTCLEAGCDVRIPADQYLCPEHLAGPKRMPSKSTVPSALSVSMTNKPHADSVVEVLEFFDDKKAWHGSQSVMCVTYLEANEPRQLLVIRRESLGTCLWLQGGDEEWISNHPVAREGEALARIESETVHIPGRFFIDDAPARATG